MFEKLSTMTTSTETPLERAVRAAVSMVVRSESASHPVGSVTMPVVVTGEVANAGGTERNQERGEHSGDAEAADS